MEQQIQMIQQLIDGAVKAGIYANADAVVSVVNAWNDIKAAVAGSTEKTKIISNLHEEISSLRQKPQNAQKG